MTTHEWAVKAEPNSVIDGTQPNSSTTSRSPDLPLRMLISVRTSDTTIVVGQAQFETTAEVCTGLATAFEHYEEQRELAWQR